MEWWLDVSGVRPLFWWTEEGTHVEFWGGAFAALGLQLMRAVGKTRSLHQCSGCGELYARPNRKAQTGRRNFCPSCGEREANRLRQERYRMRKKSGGSDDEAR